MTSLSPQLAKKLIEKGILRQNTEVDAYYKGVDIGGASLARVQGNFLIVGAKKVKDALIFECRDTRDGSKRTVLCDDILLIDGMEPDRFAGIYGMTEEGASIRQGQKRGRKPKGKTEETA